MDQPLAVVIDGYNLIKRVPDLAARLIGPAGLENARSYLLGRLRAYQAMRGRRVVLVLDGPKAGRSDFGPVEVLYATVADDTVVRLAARGTLVVSSDLAVRQNALAQGAEVLSSEDFWRALAAATGRGARPTAARPRPHDAGDEDLLRDRDDADGRPRPAKGNPRRKSKSEKRRAQARIDLMRKV